MSMESEKLVIELNFRNDIIDERKEDQPFDSRAMLALLTETVVDKRTLELIEIHELFEAMDHTITRVGSARFFHSLANPSESIELIHARQDSYCELANNVKLQSAIIDFLEVFSRGEARLFKFLNAHMQALMPYHDFKEAAETIKYMMAAAEGPRPETAYLDSLFKSILSFKGSPAAGLVTGPRYRTPKGIRAAVEKKSLLRLPFRPSRFSLGSLLPFLPGLIFGAGWLFGFMNEATAFTLFMLTAWLSLFGILYGAVIKPIFDYETAILPIRNRLIESNRFGSAIEAVAAIDELMSFVNFSQAPPHHPTCMPEFSNNPYHHFIARELRNPTRAMSDPNYVPNDITLDGCRATFITGPNSGGKTTICKSIVQNQILAQIGAPVMAASARINMADRITYQAPAFDTLIDEEGRFGTELKVTRDIFFATTPKSLVILDEIAEGTTTHEKMSLSVEIMDGFYAIGNNTLLVTHSFELVEQFRRRNKGQYLQVEFAEENPTHRMIPGVSTESHALRVATKIGFAPDDIGKHLVDKGYIAE
ncbi:MAG: DNA mismatch repair protein MutS [Desulfurivibrionaceae bacterium]